MRKTTKIFGTPIDMVTLESAFERFKVLLDRDRFAMIFTPNTEIIMKATEDEELKEVLMNSDMNMPDGIGLIIASKIHNLGLNQRVTGVDMMDRILKFCNNTKKSIYILGGKPGVAELASRNINKKYSNINIKGFNDGYFKPEEESRIIDKINEVKPDILFVALGAPRQEKWIYRNGKSINTSVAMGVGGSVDIWAGTAQRAPKIFQNLGLEWFYRLLKEPWRLKRMMVLPRFLLKVLSTKDIN